LTLGEDGVERQTGFAAAGKPGDANHFVTRQRNRDVFQVMLSRAFHDNVVEHRRIFTFFRTA
jgi:hypothetical protein